MKRFYKTASLRPAEAGYTVTLDDRPIRTPAGAPFVVPSEALAAAIAEEWRDQGETVVPASMPVMQVAATALDRVAPQRAAVIEEIVRYGGTDLLCYRATDPRPLVERQKAAWQPVLDWVCLEFDAPLAVTSGIVPVEQPEAALNALRAAVSAFDDLTLAALLIATAATGSAVLGLALVAGRIDAEEAWAASLIDEHFQAELWGEDAEAVRRREMVRDDLHAAARFLELCRQ